MLPAELWLNIMSYLDYKDLISCSAVNQTLNILSSHNSLWRALCNKHWLELKCPEELTWKEHFVNWYLDFGRYIEHYSHIKRAWNRLEAFMQTNCPQIFASIDPGVTEVKLNGIEERLHYKLPLDLRCSYRIHNGQKLNSPGLLGTVTIGSHYRTVSMLNIETAYGFLGNRTDINGNLPISLCVNTGFSEFIVLTDKNGFEKHHIYCPTEGSGFNIKPGMHFFISGKDFTSWFTEYVDALIANYYTVMQAAVFRFYHEPGCCQNTGSIKVSVATAFLSEQSTIIPPYFLHVYQITMEMDKFGPESESCQLESRHWIITDDNGHEERVDGDGVVGEYPIMRPGASFTWVSCTNFKTTYGNMKGHFTMRNLKTGQHMEIYCPIFHMKCLPYMRVPEIDDNVIAVSFAE